MFFSHSRAAFSAVLRRPAQAPARLFSQTHRASSLFTSYLDSLKPQVKEITVEDLDKKLNPNSVNGPPESFHLFDVRETYEWNEERIPYAFYTGRGTLERDIESLVPDVADEIVLYCAGGSRSLIAADSLTKMGYKNVASLQGGIGAWKLKAKRIEQNTKTFSDKLDY
ncbi:hypothetical protein HDV05_005299 [Chytridiales sp. JEL 0842]|nr:hypothetical protein HDV05_005299 [Chytridiales sp. JEL 0842]